MTDRFDKFTERARKTLQLAQEEAQRLNHNYIGTEHILLGLLREGDGVAARVLNNFGIELDRVSSHVESAVGRGERLVMGEIALKPEAKRVIESAVDESRKLNHRYVGTEHLLLGLLSDQESTGTQVLSELGASPESVREQVLEVLKSSSGYARGSLGTRSNTVGAGRFQRFTDDARKTLQSAQEEAERFDHNYIGTEHILLGLVRQNETVAGKVLNNLGIELNRVRSAVEFIIGRGDRMVMGEIGLTPRAKRVIELAVDEARRLNHHYIGTEHLLLGLVREGEGIAAGVLESLGVSLEKVRAQVIEVLKSPDARDVSSTKNEESAVGDLARTDWELKSLREGWSLREARRKALGKTDPELTRWLDENLNFHLLSSVDDSFLRIVREAMSISVFLTYEYVGTNHLLAAMLRDEDSGVWQLLREASADIDAINRILSEGVGARWAGAFTYQAVSSISLAIEEARSANQLPATPDHLLLGIVLQLKNSAAAALLNAGINADAIRLFIRKTREMSTD